MIGPGFQLGLATAGEKLARDRLTFEAWGRGLGLDQYLGRERVLRATEHGRLDMRSWVLRLPNGVVAASCETFRLPLLPSGAAEVIASVYVERGLRGVGMASRLMEALVAHRREAGLDALVLFSEVGAGLYERAGFRRLPAPTRVVPAASGGPSPSQVRLHAHDELPGLLARRRSFRDGRIDLDLTPALVEWHLARSRFYAASMARADAATVGASTDAALALWAPDFKNGRLRLLDASGTPRAALGPLFDAAAQEAARLGLEAVEHWDDAHSATLGGPPSRERDDDLPMGLSFTPRGELLLGPLPRAAWA